MATLNNNDRNIVKLCLFGILVAIIGLFCLFMVAVSMSRPVHAATSSNVEYEYFTSKDNAQIDVPINAAICAELGGIAAGTKGLLDKGLSDDEIQQTMISVAMENMSNRNTWTAFHMALGLPTIRNMRNWPNETEFQWMRGANPGLIEMAYYDMYAETKCKAIIGNKQKILKVERRVVQKGTSKQGSRT